MQEVVMGDWILAFCRARTCCLFHSIELISCSTGCRNQWHLQGERNPRSRSSLLLMRYDLTRLIADFRLCREPPQPTPGMVPCSPSSAPRSVRPALSGMWITRYEWKHRASWLPAEVIYSLEMSAGLFFSPSLSLPFPSSSPILT